MKLSQFLFFSQEILRCGSISRGHGLKMWETPLLIRNLNSKVGIVQRKFSCRWSWKWFLMLLKDVLCSIVCSSQKSSTIFLTLTIDWLGRRYGACASTNDFPHLAAWSWTLIHKCFKGLRHDLHKCFVCFCEFFFFSLHKSQFISSGIVLEIFFDVSFPSCENLFLA